MLLWIVVNRGEKRGEDKSSLMSSGSSAYTLSLQYSSRLSMN